MRLIFKTHPEGGLVTPNGERVRIAHRTLLTGEHQVALVGHDNQLHSPIFKSIAQANEWFKENTNVEEFVNTGHDPEKQGLN